MKTPKRRRTNVSRSKKSDPAADKVKDIAKTIRDVSNTARDTVKKFHESGAITDLAEAVHEAAIATKDTVDEISDTSREIRDSHVAGDTASAIEQTAKAAGETLVAVEQTAKQVPLAAPKTTKAVVTRARSKSLAMKSTIYKNERGASNTVAKAKNKTSRVKRTAKTLLTSRKKSKNRNVKKASRKRARI